MVEPEIRKFDDLDMELNEVLIRVFSAMIGLKGQVVILDREQWAFLIENATSERARDKCFKELDLLYGRAVAMKEARVIYLNPRMCKRNYQALVSTILHELLHLRYLNKNEDAIAKMERELTGRYDYKVNFDSSGKTLECKVNFR